MENEKVINCIVTTDGTFEILKLETEEKERFLEVLRTRAKKKADYIASGLGRGQG